MLAKVLIRFLIKLVFPETTVINTVQNAKERGNTESLPRSAPRKTDVRADCRLCQESWKDSKNWRVPLAKLQVNFQPNISCRAIQHQLKKGKFTEITSQEKWDQDCIEPRKDLKKDIKVIFWGCFGSKVMMSLINLSSDLESKRGVTEW